MVSAISLSSEGYTTLQNQLSIALQLIANQSVEIQILKDEIARLKGTSPRPKLPPGSLKVPVVVPVELMVKALLEENIREKIRKG